MYRRETTGDPALRVHNQSTSPARAHIDSHPHKLPSYLMYYNPPESSACRNVGQALGLPH